MFCKNCGSKIDENSRFCPNCGCEIEVKTSENVENEDIVTTENVDNNLFENVPVEPVKKEAACWKKFAHIGKIMGILSLALCLIPLLSFEFFGPLATVFGTLGGRTSDESFKNEGSLGRLLGIIGAAISFVAYFVLIIAIMGLDSGNIIYYDYLIRI